ncbi:MAG TPA: gamma-glutamyl-gamma-aminobutyrate hydrolase family protein [Myxococcota bacterium]|nr:gamma-glutamyl-gamma-aminobutyrate hydrolase family protein [Myxococcota bacterium]
MRPLIGIPPCLDERGRWRPAREYHYADAAYARAVAQAGGVPVYLPQQDGAAELAERIDGLLLPGGGDFAPDRAYPAGVAFDVVPERQLAFDRALLAATLDRDRPVLAICYGMQLLAIHCGGALHFDVPTDLPDAGEHRLADPRARHAIRVEAASRLRDVLGEHAAVNSRHHQAVADPGRARVAARSADGLVEAVELPGARFALGVQWHPESLDADHREPLFGAFVRACAGDGPRGY